MNNYYKFLVIVVCIICGFLMYFYRKPEQLTCSSTDVVHSPAYGKIMNIKREDNRIYIAIFLSPLDVHYQFAPVTGKITDIKYDATGKFNLAYELNKSNDNEKAIYTIQNDKGKFTVYQIAGFLVRRISVYKEKNDDINIGDTLGLIHFGSRVDLLIENVDDFELLVKEGDYMNGSHSIIGKYKQK